MSKLSSFSDVETYIYYFKQKKGCENLSPKGDKMDMNFQYKKKIAPGCMLAVNFTGQDLAMLALITSSGVVPLTAALPLVVAKGLYDSCNSLSRVRRQFSI